MNGFRPLAALLGALALAAVVGAMAFNAGVSRGIEQSGKIVIAAPGTVPPPVPYPYYGYGWHHPWGGGFFFGPLLFILFFGLIVRGIFWRGGWHHRGRWMHDPRIRERMDQVHREMHERMWNEGRSGNAPAGAQQL